MRIQYPNTLAALPTPQLYAQSYSLKGFVHGLLKLARSPEGLNLVNVDEGVFKVGAECPLPMDTATLPGGVVLKYCHPARAIPFLFYHPSLHQFMWRRPEAQWTDWTPPPANGSSRPPQQRVYSHPFTCDACLEALRRLPAGVRHVLIMLLLGKDKTQLGRGEKVDFDAVYLRLGNTGAEVWGLDEAQILLAVFPRVDKGNMSQDAYTEACALVYQMCWAFIMVLLEDLAVNGLRCNHRWEGTNWALSAPPVMGAVCVYRRDHCA